MGYLREEDSALPPFKGLGPVGIGGSSAHVEFIGAEVGVVVLGGEKGAASAQLGLFTARSGFAGIAESSVSSRSIPLPSKDRAACSCCRVAARSDSSTSFDGKVLRQGLGFAHLDSRSPVEGLLPVIDVDEEYEEPTVFGTTLGVLKCGAFVRFLGGEGGGEDAQCDSINVNFPMAAATGLALIAGTWNLECCSSADVDAGSEVSTAFNPPEGTT
jgi:hypothetical protein